MRKIELIIHPVRFQILRAIGTDALTTQEIADRLPDTPKSSIYRHLKLLLEHNLLYVADSRLVNGIQEKTYRLDQPARLSAEEMKEMSADDHIRFFTTFALSLVQDFSNYVNKSAPIDMMADRVGYNEVSFYATKSELDELQVALNKAVMKLLSNEPGNGRSLRKLAIVSQPLPENGGDGSLSE